MTNPSVRYGSVSAPQERPLRIGSGISPAAEIGQEQSLAAVSVSPRITPVASIAWSVPYYFLR